METILRHGPRDSARLGIRIAWRLAALCAVATLAACEDAAGSSSESLGGVADWGKGASVGDPSASPTGFAVVSSDYTVASVALLDAEGELVRERFVDSGSTRAGLVTALSGDLALPTQSADPNTLTIIDRFRSDVVTRIDIPTGRVLGQVKTQWQDKATEESGYSSNPQDFVQVDQDSAWVTRYTPNIGADADDPDQGNDIVQIDLRDLTRTGERIDMTTLDATATRENPDSGETEEVTAYARPSRAARLGDKLVVGLSRLSQSFDAIAPGMLALVDPERGRVEGFDMLGLENCSQVMPVPGDATRVAAACVGFYRGDARRGAGLAMLRLSDGELAIEHLWRASEDEEDAPLHVYGLVPLDGERVVAAAAGDKTTGSPDAAYLIDLTTGERRLLFEGDGRFVIGDGAFNAEGKILLVPDASTDDDGRPTAGVRRFRLNDDGDVSELDTVTCDELIPPRHISPL